MLNTMKTTTITALAALTLVAGLSTQANAEVSTQPAVTSFYQTAQFDALDAITSNTDRLVEDATVQTVQFRGRRGFSSRRGFSGRRGFSTRRGFNRGFNRGFSRRGFNSGFGFNRGFNSGFGFNRGFGHSGFGHSGFGFGFNSGFGHGGFGHSTFVKKKAFKGGF